PPLSHPPTPTLFPYTTLFRSDPLDDDREIAVDAEVVPFCDVADGRGPDRSLRDIGLGHCDLVRAPPPTDIVRSEHVFTFRWRARSEEHTSELQSRFDLVCRLL